MRTYRLLTRFWLSVATLAGLGFLEAQGGDSAAPESLPPLPEAVTSFGAENLDGWLYVYGGHTGKAHSYSEETTSNRFCRLNLEHPQVWENLPGASRAQGTRLVAYQGGIYRIGGMQPRKTDNGKVALYSLDDFARFDIAELRWTELAPLPSPRSSHEALILGSKLYVGGGWTMTGKSRESQWSDVMMVIDLAKDDPQWTAVPQPFRRRALSADTVQHELWFMGGMDQEGDASREVDIYDTVTGEWSKGPDLPTGPMQGFGSAACLLNGQLIVSLYSKKLLTPNEQRDGWLLLGTLDQRRFFHRIVPAASNRVIAISGTSRREGKTAALELVALILK